MDSTNKADNWRSGCSDIVSLLNKARKEERFTDIQFVLKKGRTKKTFYAHKIVLACGAPFFESMFYGPMAEKSNVVKTNDDPEAFEALLNHIYGQNNEITSFLSVWNFYLIGEKYLVPKILDISKQYIESIKITIDDFWDVVNSDVFTHPLFHDKVRPYLMENAENIIKSPRFLGVQENFVDELLQMQELNVSEYDLLLAVTGWDCTNFAIARSERLLKFYKHIKFSNLTCDEYFKFINSYPEAIEAKSSLEILQYLHTPYGRCLPSWCTMNQVSRKIEFHRKKLIIIQPKVEIETVLFDSTV